MRRGVIASEYRHNTYIQQFIYSTKMSFCPELSLSFLESTHTELGTKKEIEGRKFYQVGEGTGNAKGLIICPDVWGWGGGRTRNTADMLANSGYNVIVPQVSSCLLKYTRLTLSGRF